MKALFACLAALLLAGCATFSEDGGFGAVEGAVQQRTGKQTRWVKTDQDADGVRATVKTLLAKPLSADDAVQIALLNNPGLQASYAELGVAEADLVQAGRLPNPRLSYLRARHGDEYKIESAFTFNLFALVTVPLATEIEKRRFEQAKLAAALEALRVANETRRAWLAAVAAQETAKYFGQVKLAAEAGADLARRMAQVGNWSRLNQAREQAFYAEATAMLARARQAATSERERLARLMGLWGDDPGFSLPERLPDMPAAATELADAEARALGSRLDLQAAKRDLEGLAKSLGLTRATRFINVLEFGPARVTETPEPRKRGYEIGLEIPVFDWGSARVARAETLYMQAVHRAAELAINARSEVREAYAAYRTAYDLARHYRDEIVPLRKRISEEVLLRYNGMLMSVFELLADAREQVASVNAYIESLRDFWLAEADLAMAMNGKPAGAAIRKPTAMPAGGAAAAH